MSRAYYLIMTLLLALGITRVLPAQVPNGTDSSAGRGCGPLVRWRMPATTVVERTRDEVRMYDVLVTQARIDAIVRAAEAYCRANHNAYPASIERLISPPPAISAQMARCRLPAEDLNDSWDRPIFYAIIQGHLIVRSAGPDGRFSTIDDIGLPEAADARTSETFDVAHECGTP